MSDTTSETVQPTVITLDNNNSIQILSQYVEVAQNKGAFVLSEAELLKRAVDCILNNVPDKDINLINGRQLLIQGIHKGQRHGAYTLNDAALLSKVVQYVETTIQTTLQSLNQTNNQSVETQSEDTTTVSENVTENTENTDNYNTNFSDDLSDLAEPVPLKPKEV